MILRFQHQNSSKLLLFYIILQNIHVSKPNYYVIFVTTLTSCLGFGRHELNLPPYYKLIWFILIYEVTYQPFLSNLRFPLFINSHVKPNIISNFSLI